MAPENRTMDLRANLTAQRNAAMLFTDLDDTIVMMDPDKGMYYELGSVGSRIWTLLETPRSVSDVCDALVEEYDVTPDVCRRDVVSFIEEAGELGIIETGAPATP